MTYHEALESLAGDPHLWRYRELTADDYRDPRVRDAWRAQLIRKAGGEPPAAPTPAPPAPAPRVATLDPWLRIIRACEDHNPGCCSHPAAFCTRFNRDTSREQCIDCLTLQGQSPPIDRDF